jgi:hypothetical protein
MRRQSVLCRALAHHAWQVLTPVFVLEDGRREVRLECLRCDTTRKDIWEKRTGKQFSRSYKKDEDYATFIKDYSHADARAAILDGISEVKRGTEKRSRVRPGSRKGKVRPRDKKVRRRA